MDIKLFSSQIQYLIEQGSKETENEFPTVKIEPAEIEPMLSNDRNYKGEMFSVKTETDEFIIRIQKK